MFNNYLKIAWRNIVRHKGYSFINIFGLAVGLACCLLLFLWIRDELSFDRFHERADRIFRVYSQTKKEGRNNRFVWTPAPLAPALKSEFPEVQYTVRIGAEGTMVRYRDAIFTETFHYADPDILNVFSFPLAVGDKHTVLLQPRSMLISEEMRRKYFGSEDPVGKTLIMDQRGDFTVTGVFRNIPRNSHIRFDFLGSFADFFPQRYASQWGISNYFTYIMVLPRFSTARFDTLMPGFVEKYRGREMRDKYKLRFRLQPLKEIHLYSDLRDESRNNGVIGAITVFSAIAFIILLIACFNYVNLATARHAQRAREIGLRKVIGASRRQLFTQFMGESLFFSILSLPLALVLAKIFLPLFNLLAGKELAIDFLRSRGLVLGFTGVVIGAGFVCGLFPALFLSAFPPVRALRGVLRTVSRVSVLRQALVVGQFAVSILMIIASLVVFGQVRYVQGRHLGFDKERLVIVPLYDKQAISNLETIKNEFLRQPGVVNVTATDFFPGRTSGFQSYTYEGMNEKLNPMISWISVDVDFIKTFGIRMVAGRDFSKSFPTDAEGAVILNETAVREIGWKEPLGKRIAIVRPQMVIGVVRDFHFESLHAAIAPLAIFVYPEYYQNLTMRIRTPDMAGILGAMAKTWRRLVPGQTFSYSFFAEGYDRLYKADTRLGQVLGTATFLAVLIATLGLFGLAVFSTAQRTKEIGIRKVMGATVFEIVRLIAREFVSLVMLANIIAWPLAYYFMHRWLQAFAYHITIGIGIFFFSGLAALAIALLTVGYQSFKAARTNPVENLRYE